MGRLDYRLAHHFSEHVEGMALFKLQLPKLEAGRMILHMRIIQHGHSCPKPKHGSQDHVYIKRSLVRQS